MKITKTLEIVSGILTFFLALPNVYLTYISFTKWIQESKTSLAEVLMPAFIFLILPALLVATGAYFHTTAQRTISIIGFWMLFICGGWLAFGHFVGLLLGQAFNGYPLLGILPGFFAFFTIFLALVNILFSSTESLEQL